MTDVLTDAQRIEVIDVSDLISEASGYLNISEADKNKLQTNLPLTFQVSNTMFNRGGFRLVVEDEKRVGEITVQQSSDEESRLEEVTHYIQTAGNGELQKDLVKINRLYFEREDEILLSIDEGLVIADRAKELTIQGLDESAVRLGLATTHAPVTPDEISNAVNLKVGERYVGGLPVREGFLSAGQTIRLGLELNKVFGNTENSSDIKKDADDYILASKALIKMSQEKNRDINEIARLRDKKAELQNNLRFGLAARVNDLLVDASNLSGVAKAFEATQISLDGVGFRIGELTRQIDLQSDSAAKQSLENYLQQGCTADELLYISQLFPGKWSDNRAILEELSQKGTMDNQQALNNIRQNLLQELKILDLNITSSTDLKKTLVTLIKQSASIASTRAGLEANLIYLMDDFPADEKNRDAMLGNAKYVAAYIRATVSALKSGEFTPHGIKFDVGDFSKSEDSASVASDEVLQHAFSDPEMAVFFQELYKKADYERHRIGNADYLSMYANWQLDMQFITDGVDINEPIDPKTYNMEVSIAEARSYESIKRKQELDKGMNLRDILMEPVAKVLVAQKLGKMKEDVVFPENVMGGYSTLLRSGEFSKWIDSLWLFVEKVHTDKINGGKTMLQFFACNSVSDQEKIVKGYLKTSTN